MCGIVGEGTERRKGMKSKKIILLITFLSASLFSCGNGGNGEIGGVSHNAIHFGSNDFESMPPEEKKQIAERLERGIYTTEGIVNNIIPEGVGSWREEPNTILEERLLHPDLTMFAVLPETGETLHWYNDSWQITGFNFGFEGFETIVEIAERYLAQGKAEEMIHKTWEGYGPPGTSWEKRAIAFRDDDLLNFQNGPDVEPMAEAISTGFLTDMGEVYQSLTSEENLVLLFEAKRGKEFILWTNGGTCEQRVVWNATFRVSDGTDFSDLFPDVKYYVRFLNPDDAVDFENYIETCGCGSRERFPAVPAGECP
jgi:hypothetical protein